MIKNLLFYEKKELWISTTIFVVLMVLLVTHTEEPLNIESFKGVILPLLLKLLLCSLGFFLMAFLVSQQFLLKRIFKGFLTSSCVLLLLVLIYDVEIAIAIFFSFFIYAVMKVHLKRNPEDENSPLFLTSGRTIILGLWSALLIGLLTIGSDKTIPTFISIAILSGLLLEWYSSRRFIPEAFRRKEPFLAYTGKAILFLLVTAFPVAVFAVPFTDTEVAMVIMVTNFFVQIMITVPLSWWLFMKNSKNKEELFHLRNEVQLKAANLEFLRSQINPHFLFNALNTLYSTALEGDSEKTADGIQKLGDMMRFMLHENSQTTIALSKEVQYLKNFIELHKLRIEDNANVEVKINITDQKINGEIAPMLLIPLIENAFKHGISFQYPSYVKIDFSLSEDVLTLKVENSKHDRLLQNDPEKKNSGIGLSNVQKRLALLYPKSHKLRIEDDQKSFTITLQVKINKKEPR